ncbi:O-antigen ligase family protein [Fibrella arboris]|uniref:O-antigen ligase family protein n=1 Tax=Fibrella arboris TaxID=3242486 RepID=UPI00352190B9
MIIGSFGLLQLCFGLIGIDLLVAQWWIEGRLPRLNGFSYEPSYYATYLLLGFSLSYYLYRKKFTIYKNIPLYTALITAIAIFLSSSRMGIVVAFLQVICFELVIERKSIKQLSLFLTITILVVSFLLIILITNENLSFLLSGLGVMGGSAHSSLERLDGFLTQITIFSRNPLKGYSLGGVSQAIAFEKGVTILSQETIKPYDVSINIFVEVLTASGIIGFIFFLRYIYCLLINTIKKAKTYNKFDINSLLLNGFVWSLLFEFIILCFNQNILRAYLWVHIALLNGIFYQIKSISLNEKDYNSG